MNNENEERVAYVVEWDGKKFNNGIKKSKKSLNEFEKQMNSLTTDKKGKKKKTELNVDTVKANEDIKKYGENVDKIKVKFNALQIAGVTAITNITNTVVDSAKKIVSSMSSLNNVAKGYEAYEQNLTSLRTLINMYGTDEFDNMQYSDIEEQLQKLSWYCDETSVSYENLVSTLSSYATAGIDLDDAVESLMGFGNLVNMYGGDAATVNNLVDNIGRAMNVGKMTSAAWMQIASTSFAKPILEAAMDAAVEMGTLVQYNDGSYKTKTVKENGETIVTGGQRVTLQNKNFDTGWLTDDVLAEALQRYSEYSVRLKAFMDEVGTYDTAAQAMEDFDKLIADGSIVLEYDFSQSAFKAAQEAKSFGDAVGAVTAGLKTQWSSTFEYIIGTAEEVPKLWTSIADSLYTIFVTGENRNSILNEWKYELGGYEKFAQAISDIFSGIASRVEKFREFVSQIFGSITASELLKITDAFADFAARFADVDGQRDGFLKFISKLTDKFGEAEASLKNIKVQFIDSFGNIKDFDTTLSNINELITNGVTKIKEVVTSSGQTVKVLNVVTSKINDLGETVQETFEMILPDENVFDTITSSLTAAKDSIVSFADGGITKAKNTIEDASNAVENAVTGVKDGINDAKEFVGGVVGDVKDGINDTKEFVGGVVGDVKDGVESVKKTVDGVVGDVKDGINDVKEFATDVKDGVVNTVNTVENAIDNTIGAVTDGVNNAKDTVSNAFNSTVDGVEKFTGTLRSLFKKVDLTESLSINLKSEASNILHAVVDTGTTIYTKAAPLIKEATLSIIDDTGKAIEKTFDWTSFSEKIKNGTAEIVDKVTDSGEIIKALEFVTDKVDSAGQKVKETFSVMIPEDKLKSSVDELTVYFTNKFGELTNESVTVLNTVKKKTANGLEYLDAKFTSVSDAAVNGLNTLKEQATLGINELTDKLPSVTDEYNNLKNAVAGFGTSVDNSVKKFVEASKEEVKNAKISTDLMSNLTKAKDMANEAWAWIKDFMLPIIEKLKEAFQKVKEKFLEIQKTVNDSGFTWQNLLQWSGAIYVAGRLILDLYRKLYTLKEIKNIGTNIADIIDAFASKLWQEWTESLAKTVLSFAASVFVFAGALILLSYVDWERLQYAAIVMGGIVVAMMTIMALYSKLIRSFTTDTKAFAGAVLEIFNPASGKSVVAILTKGLTAFTTLLSEWIKVKLIKEFAKAILILTAAVLMLVVAMWGLAELGKRYDWEFILKGFAVFGIIIAGLVGIILSLAVLSKNLRYISSVSMAFVIFGLTSLVVSIAALAYLFSRLDFETRGKEILLGCAIVVGLMLAVLAAFYVVSKVSNKMLHVTDLVTLGVKVKNLMGGVTVIMLAITAMFAVLVASVILLSRFNSQKVLDAFGLVVLMFSFIVAMVAIMCVMSSKFLVYGDQWRYSLLEMSVLLVAVTLLLLGIVASTAVMGALPENVVKQGFWRVMVIFAAILAFITLVSLVANRWLALIGSEKTTLMQLAVLMLGIVTSILAMTAVVLLLGSIDIRKLDKGMTYLAYLVLLMSSVVFLLAVLSKLMIIKSGATTWGAIQTKSTMLQMTVLLLAITAIVGVFALIAVSLGKIEDPSIFWKGYARMVAILGAIVGLIALLELTSKIIFKSGMGEISKIALFLLAVSAMLLIIVGSIYIIYAIFSEQGGFSFGEFMKMASAIGIILLFIVGVIALISLIGKIPNVQFAIKAQVLPIMLLLTLLVSLVAGVIGLCIFADKYHEAIKSNLGFLGIMFGALLAAIAVLTLVGKFLFKEKIMIAYSIMGILMMAAVVAAIYFLVKAINEVKDTDALWKMAILLGALAVVIGALIGFAAVLAAGGVGWIVAVALVAIGAMFIGFAGACYIVALAAEVMANALDQLRAGFESAIEYISNFDDDAKNKLVEGFKNLSDALWQFLPSTIGLLLAFGAALNIACGGGIVGFGLAVVGLGTLSATGTAIKGRENETATTKKLKDVMSQLDETEAKVLELQQDQETMKVELETLQDALKSDYKTPEEEIKTNLEEKGYTAYNNGLPSNDAASAGLVLGQALGKTGFLDNLFSKIGINFGSKVDLSKIDTNLSAISTGLVNNTKEGVSAVSNSPTFNLTYNIENASGLNAEDVATYTVNKLNDAFNVVKNR